MSVLQGQMITKRSEDLIFQHKVITKYWSSIKKGFVLYASQDLRSRMQHVSAADKYNNQNQRHMNLLLRLYVYFVGIPDR